MSTIKKAWITKHDGGMVELSLQSEHVAIKGMRLKVLEVKSGEPTSLHKVVIGLLSVDDLDLIADAIEEYRWGE